jgi:hypothetical protein
MSATELLEKAQELSPDELRRFHAQIDELLEDIEDNAAADAAETEGGEGTSLADLKVELGLS